VKRAAPPAAREALVLTALFAVLALAAIELSRQPGAVATVWFANAVGMAFVATALPRRAPGLLAAVAAGNLLANLAAGDSVALSSGFAVANAVEVGLGGWLIRRTGAGRAMSASPYSFIAMLVAGAVVPQWAGATIGAATLHGLGYASFGHVWPAWYVGDVLGAVAVLPVALTLRQLGASAAARQLLTLPVAACALLVAGVTLVAAAALPYPFVFASLTVIAGALLLTPLGSYAMCALLAATFTIAVDFALLLPSASALAGEQLLIFLPALLSILPALLLTVVQEQQRQATRSLAALTSAAEDMMVFFDLQGRVRVVNRAWERRWQRDAKDVIGRDVLDIVPPEQRLPEMAGRVARALAGETVLTRIEQNFPLLGARSIEIAYQPAFDASGQALGVVFTGHDVTELLAAQRELEGTVRDLRTANDNLEQFARISSHDLREPLNTVAQFAGLIETAHHAELSEPVRRYFALIQQGANRMRDMLDDLLQFVRLDSANQLSLAPIALNMTLSEVLDALAARIDTRHADVQVGALPAVLGHASLLSMLFQNLVSNAVKFVPPERTPVVRITAREHGDAVIVTVEDNGIGIALDDQGKLFAPFKRLHARRKFDGTGLGLAICKRAALAMGGAVEIESQLGTGSRFHVTLQRVA
jgi:PAS domain S-box-containing protein